MRGAVAPAHHGPHAREQLAKLEGLEQVVVGAQVQAVDAVVEPVARGEHQHRRGIAAFARAPQHLGAVLARQAQVEQHAGVVAVAERALRQLAVAHPVGRPAGALERLLQAAPDHFVVFHQQYTHCVDSLGRKVARDRDDR